MFCATQTNFHKIDKMRLSVGIIYSPPIQTFYIVVLCDYFHSYCIFTVRELDYNLLVLFLNEFLFLLRERVIPCANYFNKFLHICASSHNQSHSFLTSS